ncbi:putative WSC domain protein [Xylona heveae TC161]|uniref:Putative WSC domain protein n=1 Tax=Xylona heveae (strain CBS 132557 / TC161) TaxID=1328760 RepID=A0A165HIL0_XYLHT|nr:putative WSC domain protein [Xylona heveae TC161]KZF23573.1 putative WSC domain protein [Xylona heveae TC161]
MFSALTLGLAASLASPAMAFWRMPCPGNLIHERADPIVSPGQISGHVHTIMGGNGFGFDMTYQQARNSQCSSCPITKDMSNYWVPTLYYHAQNGSFISVPQVGGATVYYEQRGGPNNDQLLAFPEGFRMLAGNPFLHTYNDTFEQQAVSYACLNYNGPATAETHAFPNNNCPDGLRAQVYFPSCWDGVNLDSPDHKSHVAYPESVAYNDGPCPASHPKHLISLFYEVIWDVNQFANDWYGDEQPFVWSSGDATGYGYHGDFVNGWDVPTLQNAVDTCLADSGALTDCPVFELYDDSFCQSCKIPPSVDEQVDGVLEFLPGCNAYNDGKTVGSTQGCVNNAKIGQPETFYTDLTHSMGWEYAGCASDNYFTRTLNGYSFSDDAMTVEKCVQGCSAKGYTYAGTEYASQCYCDNSVLSGRAPIPGVMGQCTMKCNGDDGEYCGGSGALSLYQKCGGSCQNAQYGVVGNSTSTTSATSSGTSSVPLSTGTTGATSRRAVHRRARHGNRWDM